MPSISPLLCKMLKMYISYVKRDVKAFLYAALWTTHIWIQKIEGKAIPTKQTVVVT